MNLYAESSAILAWLMGESAGKTARAALAKAEMVVASDLTLIECDRVLIRAQVGGEMSEVDLADRRAVLNIAAAHWHILHLDAAIVERARRPFPLEPIRTPDAIHLASAMAARTLAPGLALLTLDERIRTTALRLGFQLAV